LSLGHVVSPVKCGMALQCPQHGHHIGIT
jgi:hypothetical protein